MKTSAILLASLISLTAASQTVSDYRLSMSLRVPVIVDNAQSLGRRVYKTQRLVGTARVSYGREWETPIVEVVALTNRTYKVAGKPVTYYVDTDGVIWNAIGDNRTRRFPTASVSFRIDADPSYNIGDDEPDNTLIVVLSGSGRQKGAITGRVAGQIGCGCYAYGHVSPTRVLGPNGATDAVSDIASCYGTFTLRHLRTYSVPDAASPINEFRNTLIGCRPGTIDFAVK